MGNSLSIIPVIYINNSGSFDENDFHEYLILYQKMKTIFTNF